MKSVTAYTEEIDDLEKKRAELIEIENNEEEMKRNL